VAKPDATARAPSAEEEAAEDSGKQFDFYEMLPKFEVVVPEREKVEGSATRVAPIEKPGAYMLQAGSYRNFADADRVRAQLALQGIESKIQRVSVDNDTWHRVRIGPISDLAELNRTRARLRQADIDALVIKVGE
jgi:cell division protein FtsN